MLRIRRWLWRRLPVRLRSRWSPYDNWLRGYTAGFAAGKANMEAKWLGNLNHDGPYADYPEPQHHD